MKPYWLAFAVSLLLLPILSELLVAQPRFLRAAIDAGVVGRDLGAINHYAVLILVLILGESTARFAQMYLMMHVGQNVMADLRRHIFAFLHRQRLAFFAAISTFVRRRRTARSATS